MRSVKLLYVITGLLLFVLMPEIATGQCSILVPNYVTVVNGTMVTNLSSTSYYVGNGDSLFAINNPNYDTIYVESGGYYRDSSYPSNYTLIYAAANAVVKTDSGFGLVYHDNAAIIDIPLSWGDSVCTPLYLSLQQSSGLDSFRLYVTKTCAGPSLTMTTDNYIAGGNIVTDFGDGTAVTSPILAGTDNAGYASSGHVYQANGSYIIKQILYYNSLAVDSFLASYVHLACCTMSVRLYHDDNNNCSYNFGIDHSMFLPSDIEVDSNNVPVDTLSCTSGVVYTAFGNVGDVYKFKMLSLPGDIVASCPITGIVSSVFQVGVINTVEYLGFNCSTGNNFDLRMNIDSRAGSHALETYINIDNLYCAPQNGILTMNYDPTYYIHSATIMPTSQSQGVAIWNINGLSAILQPAPIHVWLEGGQFAYGTPVTTSYTITPTTGDMNQSDNTIVVIDTTTGSFDPNAIYVKPAGCVTPGTNLEYTITFENMGNGPAENIYVLDTLPPGLDQSSMKLKFASHEMYLEKIYNGPQTILKFNFPNIMLPDSSDHAGRHGMFVYTINSRNNYPIGSAINHRAGIYFDYNDPVMTNTASTGMCWPTNVNSTASKQQSILIYPNPATDELTIKTDKQYTSYTISNSIGQVMMKNKLDTKDSKLDIRSLVPGIYYMSLKGEGRGEVRKFVKM